MAAFDDFEKQSPSPSATPTPLAPPSRLLGNIELAACVPRLCLLGFAALQERELQMFIPGPDNVGGVVPGCLLGKRGRKGWAGCRRTLSNQHQQRRSHLPGRRNTARATASIYPRGLCGWKEKNLSFSNSQRTESEERRTGQRKRRWPGRRKPGKRVPPTPRRLRDVLDSPAWGPQGWVESGNALRRGAGGIAVWQGVWAAEAGGLGRMEVFSVPSVGQGLGAMSPPASHPTPLLTSSLHPYPATADTHPDLGGRDGG